MGTMPSTEATTEGSTTMPSTEATTRRITEIITEGTKRPGPQKHTTEASTLVPTSEITTEASTESSSTQVSTKENECRVEEKSIKIHQEQCVSIKRVRVASCSGK